MRCRSDWTVSSLVPLSPEGAPVPTATCASAGGGGLICRQLFGGSITIEFYCGLPVCVSLAS